MATRSWNDVPVHVQGWEAHEQAQREKLAARLDAAIERVRELERELDEIADELRHGD